MEYKKSRSNWNGGLVHWTDGYTAYISCVFSWQLPKAYEIAIWYKSQGFAVRAGGPAVSYNPGYFSGVAHTGGEISALGHHNPEATRTTTGCVNSCPFCIVPKAEGRIIELPDQEWEPARIVIDNNIMATSDHHFARVIERMGKSGIKDIDFNSGLDIRYLTLERARMIAQLPTLLVRTAWDDLRLERHFYHALENLTLAGFKSSDIRVYILIGYNDDPDDALHRLEGARAAGTIPVPMRYHPLDATKRNGYVAPNWSERELRNFTRYWFSLQYFEHIPFEKYDYRIDNRKIPFEQTERLEGL